MRVIGMSLDVEIVQSMWFILGLHSRRSNKNSYGNRNTFEARFDTQEGGSWRIRRAIERGHRFHYGSDAQ